jgi:hypothetical protein
MLCMMKSWFVFYKNWINKFRVVRFIFLQETCTTGRYNVYYTTPTRIFGHDEDLDAGRIIRFTKENGILSIASNNIILCFI